MVVMLELMKERSNTDVVIIVGGHLQSVNLEGRFTLNVVTII